MCLRKPNTIFYTSDLYPKRKGRLKPCSLHSISTYKCLRKPKTIFYTSNLYPKQIKLACDLKKPLFLHERDAHVEMVELLTRYRGRLPSCVIHCFTGSKEQAVKYLELGCYIGLTGGFDSFVLGQRLGMIL